MIRESAGRAVTVVERVGGRARRALATRAGRAAPAGRPDVEAFLAAHAADLYGHALVAGDDAPVRRVGRGLVDVDVVDLDPHAERATILADLAEAGSLPVGRYDCAVAVEALRYVADLDAALANLWAGLAPGGVLLATVPAAAANGLRAPEDAAAFVVAPLRFGPAPAYEGGRAPLAGLRAVRRR